MNRTIYILLLSLSASIATAQPVFPVTQAVSAVSPIQEKIFVHTDKDTYLAGEILWFSTYVLDAASKRPLSLSKVAYVEIISSEQRPVFQGKIALDQGHGSGSFQLPYSVRSGNYLLRAYTSWMKNSGPQSFFEKYITIINTLLDYDTSTTINSTLPPAPAAPTTSTTPLTLTTDKTTYGPREKVTLKISGCPAASDLSLSVTLQDSIQALSQDDILSFYNSPAETPSRLRSANLPEYAGLIVSGRVTDLRSSQPAANIGAWLSAPGNYFHLAYAVSDKDGLLTWQMGSLYGEHELVVQTANRTDGNRYRIEILSPYADPALREPLPPFRFPARASRQLLLHSIGAQAANAWQADKRRRFSQPPITDTTAFFGEPDKRYLLDDYTRFGTMEEVMREYVKEVKVRDHNGSFVFNVQSDQANQLFFDTPPLTLMDGVPVSGFNRIIGFDPLKVRKLEVITKRYFLGDTLYNGILSYSTYQGDLAGFPLDSSTYIQEFEGLQPSREFYSPAYATAKDPSGPHRIPDLRNQLFWSPDIHLPAGASQQFTFYTSDMPGRYTAVVQGITTDGRPLKATVSFTTL
ncbi:MAG: hypothetical protein JST42_16705 [Bacteroidetes bacterium]|nr:hypothetical protein [Bacteroidota bacterium]